MIGASLISGTRSDTTFIFDIIMFSLKFTKLKIFLFKRFTNASKCICIQLLQRATIFQNASAIAIFYFFIASLVPGRIKSIFFFDFYSVFLKLSLDMQTAPIRIYCIQSLQTEVYMRWGVGCFAEGHLGGICIFLL